MNALGRKLVEMGLLHGTPDPSWEEMYKALIAFRKEFGHFRIPAGSPLRPWATNQRANRSQDKLSSQRIRLLDAIGFVWAPFDGHFQKMLARLVEFRSKEGHSVVPQTYPADQELAHWCCTRRRAYRQGKLSQEHEDALNRLEFQWSFQTADEIWQATYEEYRAWVQENGSSWDRGRMPHALVTWCDNQRSKRRHGRTKSQGKLSQNQIKILDDLGFDWDPISQNHYVQLARLKAHMRKNPGLSVLAGTLRVWCNLRRASFKRGDLPEWLRIELTALGFDFAPRLKLQDAWETMLGRAVAFKMQFGTMNVPKSYTDKALMRWVLTQRKEKKAGRMPEAREKVLDSYGFNWNPRIGAPVTRKQE